MPIWRVFKGVDWNDSSLMISELDDGARPVIKPRGFKRVSAWFIGISDDKPKHWRDMRDVAFGLLCDELVGGFHDV